MVSSKPVNGGLSAPERWNGAYHVHALAARGLLSLKELKVDLCWSHAEGRGKGDAPFFFFTRLGRQRSPYLSIGCQHVPKGNISPNLMEFCEHTSKPLEIGMICLPAAFSLKVLPSSGQSLIKSKCARLAFAY